MLAQEKPVFDAVAQTLYKSNADEDIRYACQIREEYAFQMRRRQEQMDDLIKRNQEQRDEYEFQMRRNQEQMDNLIKRNQEQMDDLIKRNQEQQNEINALRLENKKLKGL